ncbi:MAG: ABC transporter permease, partial [Thermomonas sp.]
MKKFLTPQALIGLVIVGLILAAAALAFFWTPHEPLKINFLARLKPPSATYWLGTDEFGRDELSRLMAGASNSVWISFLTVLLSITAGTAIGVLTGFVRGWTDRIIMAFINALLAFPGLLLALALLAVFGANKYGIILALGLAYTPSVTRIVRGTVMSLREKEFIESSRVLGNSELYTMYRHVLLNCVAPLTVLATSMFGWVILADRHGLAEALAQQLEARGQNCRLVVYDDHAAAPQEDAPGGSGQHAGAIRRMIDEQLAGERSRLRGVIHLWSSDTV